MDEKPTKEGKPMKLPRFSYQVPEDLTAQFMQEMNADKRESPGDLITSILRKYFELRLEEQYWKQFTSRPEGSAIPHYGPKSSRSNAGQEQERTAGQE